jgi:hypothetical protein
LWIRGLRRYEEHMKSIYLVTGILATLSTFGRVHALTVHVPEDYETIHQALSASTSDDTVIVREYYYRERIPRFDGMPTVVCQGWEPEFVDVEPIVPRESRDEVCGDANGDGLCTVSDIVFLSNYFYSGGPAPEPGGDADNDGSTTPQDIAYLVDYFYFSGPPPCFYGWQDPMQVNEPDSLSDLGADISCARDGYHWAAWWGFTDPPQTIDEIYTSIWDPYCHQWLGEMQVTDSDSSEDYNPSIFVDQEVGVWCAWTGTTPGRGTEIFYARWDSLSGWHEEGLVNEPDSVNDGGIVIGGA